jgi:hypothetical protein
MSDTAVRYFTMMRLDPRYPSTIMTSEVAELLEERDVSDPVLPALHEVSTYFPLVVTENVPSLQWSLQGSAVVEIVQAVDLPPVLTCEPARAHLLPTLPAFKKQKCPSL